MIYHAMGPFWNGNEVWLITAGGVTFAAFPTTYAVMFSGLYSALMLILFALILRGVAMEFRSQVDHPTWRAIWDICTVVGSFLPALSARRGLCQYLPGDSHRWKPVSTRDPLHPAEPYGLLGGVLFLCHVSGARLSLAGGQNRRRPARTGSFPGRQAVDRLCWCQPWPFWWPPGLPRDSTTTTSRTLSSLWFPSS